jgi:hypothetical protein
MNRTANDRFKQRSHRFLWVGGFVAIGLHACLLLLLPPFRIVGLGGSPVKPRMVVTVGAWRAPSCMNTCVPGYVRYDTVFPPPEVGNWSQVNYRLPRLYPHLLWKYVEPSAATIEVRLTSRGRVGQAVILESSDNGTDQALLDLARMLRFSMSPPFDTAHGTIGIFEIGVAAPH